MKNKKIRSLVFSALFLALGLVLPLLTGQIKEIGDSLLPMHLPVMLCGLMCGWEYGLCVGLILPFMRSFIFGMPPLYPNAVWMSLELAAYGLIIALVYRLFKKKIPEKLEMAVTSVFLVLLLVFMAVVAVNDVRKLFG